MSRFKIDNYGLKSFKYIPMGLADSKKTYRASTKPWAASKMTTLDKNASTWSPGYTKSVHSCLTMLGDSACQLMLTYY